jgi:hypothetical protein
MSRAPDVHPIRWSHSDVLGEHQQRHVAALQRMLKVAHLAPDAVGWARAGLRHVSSGCQALRNH